MDLLQELLRGDDMKLICIGDNVVDCYLDDGLYYPGGNAVNVAVNAKKDGAEKVGYIGVFGDDEEASNIIADMHSEGVDTTRSRKVYAPSAHPGVKLVDGDRVFVKGLRDTCQHLFSIRIVDEDIALIKDYDLIHTSCYSNLEYELKALSKLLDVSFDYSDRMDDEYLGRTIKYVKYAFFSASGFSDEEAKAFLRHAYDLGGTVIGVTRGSKGALFYDGEKFYAQAVKFVQPVDTMGAGDSFIAGFLVKIADGNTISDALDYAASVSAETCLVHGGWGHPHKL